MNFVKKFILSRNLVCYVQVERTTLIGHAWRLQSYKVDRHRTQKQHVFLGVTTTLRKEAVKPEFDINMATTEGNLYLGFDFSTQQIKAVIIDEALKVIAEEHVNFDQDV